MVRKPVSFLELDSFGKERYTRLTQWEDRIKVTTIETGEPPMGIYSIKGNSLSRTYLPALQKRII